MQLRKLNLLNSIISANHDKMEGHLPDGEILIMGIETS